MGRDRLLSPFDRLTKVRLLAYNNPVELINIWLK